MTAIPQNTELPVQNSELLSSNLGYAAAKRYDPATDAVIRQSIRGGLGNFHKGRVCSTTVINNMKLMADFSKRKMSEEIDWFVKQEAEQFTNKIAMPQVRSGFYTYP